MAKEQTATFIGHKECYGVSSEQVREEIIKLIESGELIFSVAVWDRSIGCAQE